jgi:dienelactone hydrolase
MTNRFPRITARRALITIASLLILVVSFSAYLLRDPLPRFHQRRSTLASVTPGPEVIDGDFVLSPVRLTATSGLAVDLVVRRARADSGKRLPVAIVLGGHFTGDRAARLLGPTEGVLAAAMSYPFAGNPRPDALTFLREIPKIRGAFLDTPPAVMLALDYLLRLPDADTTRVEAIGVSLGAPFICIAGALDPRISRVWALHGSGGSYVPLEANMRRTIRFAPLRKTAAAMANVIIAGPRLDPVKWVSRIAPRAFVMVNASDDERLPRSSVDALYAAAGQPKEQLWMAGAHVHGDSATINRLVGIVMPKVRASTP